MRVSTPPKSTKTCSASYVVHGLLVDGRPIYKVAELELIYDAPDEEDTWLGYRLVDALDAVDYAPQT